MESLKNTNPQAIDLTRFDRAFEEASVEERNHEPVPDGKYQVNVEKVEITRARYSGDPMLKWTLRVLGPSCRGRVLWLKNILSRTENVKWLKENLHVCGLDLKKLSDLEDHLDRLLNIKLEVYKRTKGEHENVYLRRRIPVEIDPFADDVKGNIRSDSEGSDDLPF